MLMQCLNGSLFELDWGDWDNVVTLLRPLLQWTLDEVSEINIKGHPIRRVLYSEFALEDILPLFNLFYNHGNSIYSHEFVFHSLK